ncbi:MAG: TRAP transporter substrate-binding protein [Azospirillaceae bacterium]
MTPRLRGCLAALAATTAIATAATAAQAETWRIQSHLPTGHPVYQAEVAWAERVNVMLGGRLELEVLPGGAIVAYNETIDAMSQGIIDGDITSPVYFSGREPALAMLGDMVGGYESWDQALAFCELGGGKELFREILSDFGVHLAGCGNSGIESLVSAVPIRTVEDIEGVKIRAPEGLAAELFREMGAAPVNLPGTEVYTSLEKGVIEAADYSSYVMNQQSGLHDIAPYPLLHFHSMPVLAVSFAKSKFDSQPEDIQAILEMAARDLTVMINLEDMVAEGPAIAEDAAEGVEVIDWSTEDRLAMRETARGIWADYAERSEMAQRAYDANVEFMQTLGLLD